MADADPAVVLVERDIEHPVETVFDAPVAADGWSQRGRVGRQAGQVVTRLGGDGRADPAAGLEADDAAELRPGAVRVDVVQVVRVADGQAAALLDPAMALVDGGVWSQVAQRQRRADR